MFLEAFHRSRVKGVCKLFQKKQNIIEYHVKNGTKNACELNDSQYKFYNNFIESINKLLKHWQSYKEIHLYALTKEYKELVE